MYDRRCQVALVPWRVILWLCCLQYLQLLHVEKNRDLFGAIFFQLLCPTCCSSLSTTCKCLLCVLRYTLCRLLPYWWKLCVAESFLSFTCHFACKEWTRGELTRFLSSDDATQIELASRPGEHNGGAYERVQGTIISTADEDEVL